MRYPRLTLHYLSQALSFLLVVSLATSPLPAQTAMPVPSSEAVAPASLQLRVIESDPVSLPVASRSAKGITVEVTNQSAAPVQNAAVVFRLPDAEPSGVFADGSRAAIAYTDATGHVHLSGIRWGGTQGSVALRITAVKENAHAGTLFEQTLTAPNSVLTMPVSQPAVSQPQISLPAQNVLRPTAASRVNTPVAPPAMVPVEDGGSRSKTAPRTIADGRTPEAAAPTVNLNDDSPDANVPLRHFAESGALAGEAPSVSITSAGPESGGGHSKKKWLIVLGAAAGAGAAMAMLHKGGSSTSSPTSGITIGSPTVSIGHP